jgi:hypothetical protein
MFEERPFDLCTKNQQGNKCKLPEKRASLIYLFKEKRKMITGVATMWKTTELKKFSNVTCNSHSSKYAPHKCYLHN